MKTFLLSLLSYSRFALPKLLLTPGTAMNRIALSILLLVGTPATMLEAQIAVPPEMEQLRLSYEAARERATRPIDEKYLAELSKLQDSFTKAAKLEQAVAAANEIKRTKERLGLLNAAAAPELAAPVPVATKPPSGVGGQDNTVVIPSNDPNGYRIGAVKRGDTITLQYMEGLWKSQGGIATENPDNPKASYGDNDRVVIAEAADSKGKAGTVLRIVPPDTVAKPFTYVFQTTRDDVVLRIHNNSERKQNPGTVTYKVKLVR